MSNGAGKIPGTPTGPPSRSGKMSPKKKMHAQPVQQLPQTFPEPNFDPESSNSTSFVNVGPGFSPFATPLKRDEMSYDWVILNDITMTNVWQSFVSFDFLKCEIVVINKFVSCDFCFL